MQPGTRSGGAAIGLGGVAVVSAGITGRATILGVSGLLVLWLGMWRQRSAMLRAGAIGLCGAVLEAGLNGAGTVALVAAAGATVGAWTLGETRVLLASSSPKARTGGFELLHIGGTILVITAVGGVVLAPRLLPVSPSPLGVALVLFGGSILTVVLRTGDRGAS